MTNTPTGTDAEAFERRKARIWRAKARLTAALAARGVVEPLLGWRAFDGYLDTKSGAPFKYHLTWRGLTQLWRHLFPKPARRPVEGRP